LTTAEIYDPATYTWSGAYPIPCGSSIRGATLTLLQDGRALYAGGVSLGPPGGGAGGSNPWFLPCVYDPDPSHPTWTYTGYLAHGHTFGTATLLTDGKVLLAGGRGEEYGRIEAAAELFDPTNDTWSSVPNMNAPRWGHSAALLPNG